MRRPWHGLAWGSGLVLAFALYRFILLLILPDDSWSTWLVVDTLKDPPRILGSVIAFFLLRRYFRLDALERLFAGKTLDIALLAVAEAFLLFSHAQWAPKPVSLGVGLLLCFSSLAVAAFEELTIRGLIHESLTDIIGANWAACVGALVFMVFHVQAQPLWYFPCLFLFGLVAARARIARVGFGWLIGFHWLTDTAVFWVGFGAASLELLKWLVLLIIALRISAPETDEEPASA